MKLKTPAIKTTIIAALSLFLSLFNLAEAVSFSPSGNSHNKSYGHQITDELSRTGETSERFEVRYGDCDKSDCITDRQRYERGIYQPYSDNDYWYSWSFYLPNNFMIQPAGTAMGQAKLLGKAGVMWMVLTKHTDYIQIASDNKEQKCNLVKIDDTVGKWTDIMIRANYSVSSKNPLDVWINGRNVDCNFKHPLISKKKLEKGGFYKTIDGKRKGIAFKYGIYQTFISRWLDKRKTKSTSGDVDTEKWRRPSGRCCKSPDNTPFNEDWGVETPTAVMYYDEIKVGNSRDEVNTLYDNSILDAKKPMLKKGKLVADSNTDFKVHMRSHKKSYGFQVTSELSRTGKTSDRIEVKYGDCSRVDCDNDRQRYARMKYIPIEPDEEYWYSGSFYMPSNFMIQPAGTTLIGNAITNKNGQTKGIPWQIHSKMNEYIQLASHTGGKCNLIKVDDAVGKWVDYMVRAEYSASSKNPVDVWINGKNVGCNLGSPIVKKNLFKENIDYKARHNYGIYQSFISRWLDKHKTKETSGDVDIKKWRRPSGKCCKSPDNTPFNEDWGVETPTAVAYFDNILTGSSRDEVNLFYDDAVLDLPLISVNTPNKLFEAQLAEENKSSLFDGRYSFDLFRYHDDEDWQELGNGFVEIRNGEVIIDKHSSDLQTGSTDLYDTFSGQINKNGKVAALVELDILNGKDRSEIYHLNGQIDEKIWGDSPREHFFRVYMLLVRE